MYHKSLLPLFVVVEFQVTKKNYFRTELKVDFA